MGVYIPTWRKPDDCLQCPFHRAYEDGTISCELPKSSPDDCKMVDVKAPHGHRSGGRLMDKRKLTFEAYTLVLKHSIWDGGVEHQLEEPIAVRCMVDATFGNSTNVINEMIEKNETRVVS